MMAGRQTAGALDDPHASHVCAVAAQPAVLGLLGRERMVQQPVGARKDGSAAWVCGSETVKSQVQIVAAPRVACHVRSPTAGSSTGHTSKWVGLSAWGVETSASSGVCTCKSAAAFRETSSVT